MINKTAAVKTGKVLVVTRDPNISNVLRAELTRFNFQVIDVEEGNEALKIARIEMPDVVFLAPDLTDTEIAESFQQLKQSSEIGDSQLIIIGETPDKDALQPTDPENVVELARSIIRKKRQAENLNALTGLPDQLQLSNVINNLIERKEKFAAIYFDIDNLKIFNKVYDYARGDLVIRLLANITTDVVRQLGNESDMVAHLGGDDFVVVTSIGKARTMCRRIISEFSRRKRALYADKTLPGGHTNYESPSRIEEERPIMNLRAAVITNEKCSFQNYLEVSNTATERMTSLRRFPDIRSSYELTRKDITLDNFYFPSSTLRKQREEIKTLQGILYWLDLLMQDIKSPLETLRESMKRLEEDNTGIKAAAAPRLLNALRKNVNNITHIIETTESLATDNCPPIRTVPEEINLMDYLDWLKAQVKDQAEQRKIEIDIQKTSSVVNITTDGKCLAQSLLYFLEAEVLSSHKGDRLEISVLPRNRHEVCIKIYNANHQVPQPLLNKLLQGQWEDSTGPGNWSRLYLGKLLVQGLGGNFKISSKDGQGITYQVVMPQKWQSCLAEVNNLLLAEDISRKQARAEIKNLQNLTSPLPGIMPSELQERFDVLRYRVQELGILCNRSLYLAENYSLQLETKQAGWLERETERVLIVEALTALCGEMARPLVSRRLFDLASARRVAKNALAMAAEFRMSLNARQALYYAALLKDLRVVFSDNDMLLQTIVIKKEDVANVKACFKPVWKAVTMVRFLKASLALISLSYEKYNSTGQTSERKGVNIPLEARILAVACAFDSITSNMSSGEAESPRTALQKIVRGSGTLYDPDVVNAFLLVMTRANLGLK